MLCFGITLECHEVAGNLSQTVIVDLYIKLRLTIFEYEI